MFAAFRSCFGVALIIVLRVWRDLGWGSSTGMWGRGSLHKLQTYGASLFHRGALDSGRVGSPLYCPGIALGIALGVGVLSAGKKSSSTQGGLAGGRQAATTTMCWLARC